ncbi:MAG TPA: hypothetical protein VFA46_12255 [Actinomycetes bacterium]|nr:hypothetical protein [Actinomycetes bacterium]
MLVTSIDERELRAVREGWLAAALATGRADRGAAERAVRLAYQAAGLDPPSALLWCESPLEMARVMDDLLVGLDNRREAEVAARIRGRLLGERTARWLEAAARLGEQRREELGLRVWRAVGAPLRLRAMARLTVPVLGQVRASLEPLAWVRLESFVLRAFDPDVQDPLVRPDDEQDRQGGADWWVAEPLGWPVDLAAFAADQAWTRALGAPARPGPLTAQLMEVARAAGWWWPLRHVAVLSERPALVRWDAAGRLHADGGPAVRYPDRFAVWAWHGVRVPRMVVERPQRLTAGSILQEADVEARRVMVERYGQARFLRDSGAAHQEADDWGTLWRLDLVDEEPLVMVEVIDSTPEPDGGFRTYWLRVPPAVATAREAVAWTFGMGSHDYGPRVQT